MLRYVDEGKSPQLFLKECFDKVESSSASQQGTSAGFATFHDRLLEEIQSEWPAAADLIGATDATATSISTGAAEAAAARKV